MNEAEHRQLREQLGGFVLGHLDPESQAALRGHLDGCTACRAELALLAPLASVLSGADPDRLGEAEHQPSPELGQRIFREVGRQRDRRTSSQGWGWVAVGGVAAAAVVGAFMLGARYAESSTPAATAPPIESITVESARPGVEAQAALVAHTWGTEIKLEASGLRDGGLYRVMFTDGSGSRTPAGTFLGTGDKPVACNLNAALLRPDASAVAVMNAQGVVVLSADLT